MFPARATRSLPISAVGMMSALAASSVTLLPTEPLRRSWPPIALTLSPTFPEMSPLPAAMGGQVSINEDLASHYIDIARDSPRDLDYFIEGKEVPFNALTGLNKQQIALPFRQRFLGSTPQDGKKHT